MEDGKSVPSKLKRYNEDVFARCAWGCFNNVSAHNFSVIVFYFIFIFIFSSSLNFILNLQYGRYSFRACWWGDSHGR